MYRSDRSSQASNWVRVATHRGVLSVALAAIIGGLVPMGGALAAAPTFTPVPLIEGVGTVGSFPVPFTPVQADAVRVSSSGLAPAVKIPNPSDPASPITGSISAGEVREYRVELPGSIVLARFELDATCNTAGVDLQVFRDDGVGGALGTDAAPGPTALTARELFLEPPGLYRVVVTGLQGDTDFTLQSYMSRNAITDGRFFVYPGSVDGEAGVPAEVTFSWGELAPETTYVSLIGYAFGEGSVTSYTTTRIQTRDVTEPNHPVNLLLPGVTGTAHVGGRLLVSPGVWAPDGLVLRYQWQRDGSDIVGATKARYRSTADDAGTSISAVVSASLGGVTVSRPTATGVDVAFASRTRLAVDRHKLKPGQAVSATVSVRSDGPVTGEAQVRVIQNSVVVRQYDVALSDGVGSVSVPATDFPAGRYEIAAAYPGTDLVNASQSRPQSLTIRP